MAKEHSFYFLKKIHSKNGITSTIYAGMSLLLFCVSVIISFAMRGKAGLVVGAFSLMAILFSIYGFVRGLRSFSDQNCSHTYCIIGSISNGILMVIWLTLFLIGI